MEVALLMAGALFGIKAMSTKKQRTDEGEPMREAELETVALANARRVAAYDITDVRRQTYAREDKLASAPQHFLFRMKTTAPSGSEQEYRYWTGAPMSTMDRDYAAKRNAYLRTSLLHEAPHHVFKNPYSRYGYHSEGFTDNPDQRMIRTSYA